MGTAQLLHSSSAGSLGTGNCVILPVSLRTMDFGILRAHEHGTECLIATKEVVL